MKRPRIATREITDEQLVALCARFLEVDETTEQLAKWLEVEHGLKVKRSKIYALLNEARERKLIRLQVRNSRRLEEQLSAALGVEKGIVRVVDADGASTTEQVALHGAEVAIELIRRLGRESTYSKLRLGLGGGRTLRKLAGQLATVLPHATDVPPLAIHALSAGFEALAPQDAPITFLGAFEPVADELVGIFSPGVIKTGELETMKQEPGIAQAFRLAQKIDLVVTSLASAHDESGALNRFLAHGGHPKLDESRDLLLAEEWVGDILYEPYNRDGPILADLPVQPVSVFTLKQLAKRAEQKYVLLVVGPSESGRTRTDALMPLLTSRKLKVWTHLVLDARTCEEAVRRLAAAKR